MEHPSVCSFSSLPVGEYVEAVSDIQVVDEIVSLVGRGDYLHQPTTHVMSSWFGGHFLRYYEMER